MRLAGERIAVDEGIVLAPRTPSDHLELYAVVDRDRADLREWLGWIDATRSPSDARRYAQFAEAQFSERRGFDYAIRFDGDIVGAMGLHAVDWTSASAQVGYWVRPGSRGLGIITRACAALTTHAFSRLHLHRLEIRCVTENERSRRVAERLGYRYEGILREAFALHGRFRDLALYAMLAAEWKVE